MSLGRGLYSLLSTSFLFVVSHDYDRAHVGMRTPLRTGLALLTHPAPANTCHLVSHIVRAIAIKSVI